MAKKVQRKKGSSNGADVATMARELCRLLGRDASDAAVVARAGLAALSRGVTVLDGSIVHGDRLAGRLSQARAVLENTEHADDRRRWREIDAVEMARCYQTEDPEDRVGMLYAQLKSIDPRWTALGPKLTATFTRRLAGELAKKRPGAVKLAADLALRAGIESGKVHDKYKQSSSRHSKR